jgi:hypothetical protein
LVGSELTDKTLRRGVFHSVSDLIAAIEDHLAAHNDEPKPRVWTATASHSKRASNGERGRLTSSE